MNLSRFYILPITKYKFN